MKSLIFLIVSLVVIGCNSDFLNIPDKAEMVIPSSIEDFQRIIDNSESLMNVRQCYILNQVGSDEYYLTDQAYNGLSIYSTDLTNKLAYTWERDVFQGITSLDWNYAYARILNANIVLDGLKNMTIENEERSKYELAKGSALFFRAYNYYQLAQTFCVPYDSNTASKDLGLPLRLESDVSLKSKRSTLNETYNRIIKDLKDAEEMLPNSGIVKMRPSKSAVFALLSKVYLQMADYKQALNYAEKFLQINNELLDYNLINLESVFVFPYDYGMTNKEVSFFSSAPAIEIVNNQISNVDTNLLMLYDENDLRKNVYFYKHANGNINFRGSYFGRFLSFTGFSTSEFILIKAECLARLGNANLALLELNRLLKNRYVTGTYVPYQGLSDEETLNLILEERRKELAFRGVRWEDLRRLNKEERFATTLKRRINGVMYTLLPNDKRYTWPIPPDVIRISNIEQNIR